MDSLGWALDIWETNYVKVPTINVCVHRKMQNPLNSVRAEASANGSKSTALQSLVWAIGIFVTGLTGLVLAHAPAWLLIAYGVIVVSVVGVFLYSHLYLMKHDIDALRSEEYALSKMAMQKGLIGDSTSGLHDPTPRVSNRSRRSKAEAPVAIPTSYQGGDTE